MPLPTDAIKEDFGSLAMNTDLSKRNRSMNRSMHIFYPKDSGNNQADDTVDDLNENEDLALDAAESILILVSPVWNGGIRCKHPTCFKCDSQLILEVN